MFQERLLDHALDANDGVLDEIDKAFRAEMKALPRENGAYKLYLCGFSDDGFSNVFEYYNGNAPYYESNSRTQCLIASSNDWRKLYFPDVCPTMFVCGVKSHIVGAVMNMHVVAPMDSSSYFAVKPAQHMTVRYIILHSDVREQLCKNFNIQYIVKDGQLAFQLHVKDVVVTHRDLVLQLLRW